MTRRSELAVFASLGLAGIVMVVFAAAQMTKFVAGSDRMTAALAGRTGSLAVATLAEESRTGGTNASGTGVTRTVTSAAPVALPDETQLAAARA